LQPKNAVARGRRGGRNWKERDRLESWNYPADCETRLGGKPRGPLNESLEKNRVNMDTLQSQSTWKFRINTSTLWQQAKRSDVAWGGISLTLHRGMAGK